MAIDPQAVDTANRLVDEACKQLTAILKAKGYRDPRAYGWGNRFAVYWRKNERGYDDDSLRDAAFADMLAAVEALPPFKLTIEQIEATLGVVRAA